MPELPSTGDISPLLAIMARLRDPVDGCPWDVSQDFDSIAGYTLEEAHEVVDAIDRRNWPDLCDELGDLLLQVVFHARMAEEGGLFDFADVVQAISSKLVRRHPHVFGDMRHASVEDQARAWEEIKAGERAAGGEARDDSALAGVSRGLPAWRRARKLQQRAAEVGFTWPDAAPVLDKLAEELGEVREAVAADAGRDRIEDEIGDMLFVLVNLCRHTGTDFDRALRHANAKFERRFRAMEQHARERRGSLGAHSLSEQEALWREVKRNREDQEPER